jgi:predicted nucleotidyltransferase
MSGLLRASVVLLGILLISAVPDAAQVAGRIRFTDVAAVAGLAMPKVQLNRTTDFLIDTTGSGVAFFDYDQDRDLDILIVNTSSVERLALGGDPMLTLYRNDDARFTDVTFDSGLTRLGWASGVCVADVDNDGFEDMYITAYGSNVLWRNVKGRSFVATKDAAERRWSTGCAFGDYDRDGDVDLYVSNYVKFDPKTTPKRGAPGCKFLNIAVACGPRPLAGEPDRLYRNRGDGTFTDVTKQAGVTEPGYYGFSVLFSDLDDDGWPDIYVANDSTPSLFFRNRRDGTFVEQGLQAGVAVSGDGREQAGMGVDAADYDGDGLLDIVKTNFAQDYTSLYRNQGNGLFVDASFRSGLGATLGPNLGWGVGFVDADNDGLLDLFIANGHIYPDVARTGTSTYRQRNQVFKHQTRGRFRPATTEVGSPLLVEKSHRGAAFGDYDNDGDIDVVVSALDDRPTLLRNDTAGGHWITMRLEGTTSNRSAIGAKVTIEAAGRKQVAEVRSGGSYISHNDSRVHFGLGGAQGVDSLTIRWPGGKEQVVRSLPADRFYVAREGGAVQVGR